jgi:hypothetical protein
MPPSASSDISVRSGRTELARRLSLTDSIAIVAGCMIGGGIFLVPNLVARSLPSMSMIMTVWLLAGVVSLVGALACAELGAAFPAIWTPRLYHLLSVIMRGTEQHDLYRPVHSLALLSQHHDYRTLAAPWAAQS